MFTRVDEKRWKMEKPVEARADSGAVDRMIDDLLSARKDGKNDVPKNLAELGLDKPSVTVTLSRKDGTKYTVSLGNVTLGGIDAKVFALSSDNPNQAIDIRHQMHDVRVALDHVLLGNLYAARFCNAAEIIAAEVD